MKTIYLLTFVLELLTPFRLVISAEVGDTCTVKHTRVSGICKISSDCPEVEDQAKVGISPTICGFIRNTIPIVCCENTIGDFLQPNDNSFLNGNFQNPDLLVFEPDIAPQTSTSKSEQKCAEYSKSITGVVDALPLITNPEPISINVAKCDYNGVPLIVGGMPAAAGEFPYMVALGFRDDNEIKWNCGGTLVSDRFVMTAAHCANTNAFGPPVIVRLGDLDLSRTDDETQHIDHEISQIVVHPNYRPPLRYNDIALIKLRNKVNFNKYVRPACLWTAFAFQQNTTIATGWGKTDQVAEASNKLLKVALSIIPNTICGRTYQKDRRSLPEGIKSTMMCAGDLRGGKDTCQGDSGGPLIVTKVGNQCIFYAIGITSFGKLCGAANSPAVYTRISEFVPWIERTIW